MTREEAIADIRDNIKPVVGGISLDMAIKALEQEPCEDAISRQALLDDFGFSEKTRKWGGDHSGYNTMMLYEIQDMIESASPVKPQEKTGHWILGICDNCGYDWGKDAPIASVPNFCPSCGARMVKEQESEKV